MDKKQSLNIKKIIIYFVMLMVAIWAFVDSGGQAVGTSSSSIDLPAAIAPLTTYDYSDAQNNMNFDAEGDGEWSGIVEWGIVPAHAIVNVDGKVLTFGTGSQPVTGGIGDRGNGNGEYEMVYHLYDPESGQAIILETAVQTDLFCAAAAIIPQTNDVLITGGDSNYDPSALNRGRFQGIVQSNIFDANEGDIDADPFGNMEYERWYPTVVTQGDGSIVVLAGRDGFRNGVGTPELYVPGRGYKTLSGAYSPLVEAQYWYPRAWPTSDGKIVIVLADNNNQSQPHPTLTADARVLMMDTSGDGSIVDVGGKPFAFGVAEPAVMIDEDLVLFLSAEGELWTMDISSGAPVWASVGQLDQRLAWSNMTLLPDGSVMISGGSATDNRLVDVNFDVFFWHRDTHAITVGAPQSEERLYHSTTLLLGDGSVMSAGGGAPGPIIQRNGEFYRPAYFFDQNGNLADRIEILSAPERVKTGEPIQLRLEAGASVSRVTMVKHGSTTHALNMDARFHEPQWSQNGTQITVVPTSNSNVLTPGAWMVFVFDENDVPSSSKSVVVEVPTDENLQASNSGEFIETGNGDDIINGGNGADVIDSGFGNDLVTAMGGPDVLIGGFGEDLLAGRQGNDYLFGGPLPVPEPIYYFRVDEGIADFAAAAGYNFSHENLYKFNLGSANSWSRTSAQDGGAAVEFSGSGVGLTLNNSLDLGGATTVSAYARFDDLENGVWQRVFDFSNGPFNDNILLTQVKGTNSIRFEIYNGRNSAGSVEVADVIVPGEWAHWTATVSDTGAMALYKNGALIGSAQGEKPNIASRTVNYLGDSPWQSDSTLNGAITDVAIFMDELSATEVAIHFGQVQDSEPLVAFEDGDDILYGSAGTDIFDGAAGNDILHSDGNDPDYLVFSGSNFGNDVITGWTGGSDKIVFTQLGLGYSDLIFTQDGANTVIKINGYVESSITVNGVNVTDFSSADFIFDTDFIDLAEIVDGTDFFDSTETVDMDGLLYLSLIHI